MPRCATGGAALDALDLPPALDGLERRFLLARLVLQMGGAAWRPSRGEPPLVVRHPAAALALADDLARLMDDMTTREVPWQRLDGLVPDASRRVLAAHAATSSRSRASSGRRSSPSAAPIEPAERRDRLIAAEAARLAAAPDSAGDRGGLDRLDAGDREAARHHRRACPMARWCCPASIPSSTRRRGSHRRRADGPAAAPAAAGHPQFAMHALLGAHRHLPRREVARPCGRRPPHGREILRERGAAPGRRDRSMARRGLARPGSAARSTQALAGITVIEAANAEEEALAVAVALREALTEPDARPPRW